MKAGSAVIPALYQLTVDWKLGKATTMTRLLLTIALIIQSGAVAFGQGPAFIPQVSPGQGVEVPQAGSPMGVYIDQLPPGAQPRRSQPRPTQPAPGANVAAERVFVATPEAAKFNTGAEPSKEQAIVPFAAAARPPLPLVQQGVGVSLTTGTQTLPTIGAGAVLL